MENEREGGGGSRKEDPGKMVGEREGERKGEGNKRGRDRGRGMWREGGRGVECEEWETEMGGQSFLPAGSGTRCWPMRGCLEWPGSL